MRHRTAIVSVLAFSLTALGDDKPAAKDEKPTTSAPAQSVLDFTVKNVEGKDTSLAAYKGDVVLIVNVASKCGLTPQYKDLQALYEKYKDKGLRIAAFPANNFMGQEPGTNAEIKEFCEKNYKVSFDIYSKISVKGDDQAELYRFLTANDTNPGFGGEIKWNFTKFLVGRDGKIIARFEPRESPSDEKTTKAIEQALAAAKSAPEKTKP